MIPIFKSPQYERDMVETGITSHNTIPTLQTGSSWQSRA
jgi:hypothetical protein